MGGKIAAVLRPAGGSFTRMNREHLVNKEPYFFYTNMNNQQLATRLLVLTFPSIPSSILRGSEDLLSLLRQSDFFQIRTKSLHK